MAERAPFDPSDPFDAMSETFRREIVDIAIKAEKIAIYRDLSPDQQLEAFVAGAMTAIVCVCFASIEASGRDQIIEYLSGAWPQAREMAEGIEEPRP